MANFAIVIGIDSYANPDWNLDAAADDAVRFARWALEAGGVEPETLRLLLSTEVAKSGDLEADEADSRTILRTIHDFQEGAGSGGERLYFYFAGHGLSAPGIAEEPVLIPADVAELPVDAQRMLAFSGIMPVLNATPPSKQFYFIDACRDFGLEEFQPAVGRPVGPWRPSKDGDDQRARSSQFVLYATSPGERAYEASRLRRGVFGGALLEGLNGKPAASRWSSRNDRYEIGFSTLSEYVRNAVQEQIGGQDDWKRYVQLPEPLTIRGTEDEALLSSFTADQMGVLPVRVRVGPSAARPSCAIKLVVSVPGVPEGIPISEVGPPSERSNTLEVAPNYYSLRATADGHAPYRQACDVFAPRTVDLRLEPAEQLRGAAATYPLPGPAEDASDMLGGLHAQSLDPTPHIEVHDAEGNPLGEGRGEVTVEDLEPGIYRIRMLAVEGATTEQVVEVDPGAQANVSLEAPGPLMGTDQLQMLSGLGISSVSGYLHPSEHLSGFANARFGSLLAFAAFAAHWPDMGDFRRLRDFGVHSMSDVAPGRGALLLLVGASGDHPVPEVSREKFLTECEFAARNLEGETVAQGGLELLPNVPAAAQSSAELEPGCITVELRLPGLAPTRYALATLRDRATVVVAVAEDTGEVEVQQYLIPIRDPADGDFLLEAPANIRRLEVAQRYYAGERQAPDEDLLDGKWLDPLLGCLAGYALVAAGDVDRYRATALTNMLEHFGGLPDSHILAGLCEPDARDEHFSNAFERGLPLFADGFRALYEWYRERERVNRPLWVMPSLLLPGSPWTAWVASRPTIQVKSGSFDRAPVGWNVLERKRETIEAHVRSVGRLREVDGDYPAAGTAFMVAEAVIMTMDFVIEGIGARHYVVDFTDGQQPGAGFEIDEVIAIESSDSDGRPGIALLRVDRRSRDGQNLPLPLALAATLESPSEGRQVYVTGYPGEDARVPPDVVSRTMGNTFGVKRIQPGQVLAVTDDTFQHDCFTLGGNAGSPVLDVETGLVIGVHYAGQWVEYKRGEAVLVPNRPDDRLLQSVGARFEVGR